MAIDLAALLDAGPHRGRHLGGAERRGGRALGPARAGRGGAPGWSPTLARLLRRRPRRRRAGGALHRRTAGPTARAPTTTPGCSGRAQVAGGAAAGQRRGRRWSPSSDPSRADLVLTRPHGLDPMAGTDLDPVLRNLGVTTIVVTGVSVNVAVTNLVMDAVNLGYQVVLPRDAVARHPARLRRRGDRQHARPAGHRHHHRRRGRGPGRRRDGRAEHRPPRRPRVGHDARPGALGGRAVRRRRGPRRRRRPPQLGRARPVGRRRGARLRRRRHRAGRPGGDLGAELLGVGRRRCSACSRPAAWSCRSTPATRAPRPATSCGRSRARLLVTVERLPRQRLRRRCSPTRTSPTSSGHRRAAPAARRRRAARPWADFVGVGRRDRPPATRSSSVARRSRPDDVADILFTSGTTGNPKGVVCRPTARRSGPSPTGPTWSGLRQGDRYLVVNPFFHAFGYKAGIIACLITGATLRAASRCSTSRR